MLIAALAAYRDFFDLDRKFIADTVKVSRVCVLCIYVYNEIISRARGRFGNRPLRRIVGFPAPCVGALAVLRSFAAFFGCGRHRADFYLTLYARGVILKIDFFRG